METTRILQELQELTATNRKGVEALFEAEEELAHAEAELDSVEARAFLEAGGSVAERTARAKLAASDFRLARDVARASVTRIKTKLRVIESEIVAQSTMAKLLAAEARL